MSNITFNTVLSEVESVIQARLAYASENEALLSLFNGVDPKSLRPKYSHKVYTLLLDANGNLDKNNIEFTCYGFLLVDHSDKVAAAVTVDVDRANISIRSLDFGPIVTNLFEQIQAAESEIVAPPVGGYEPAWLKLPEVHEHALWLRPRVGNDDDCVRPFGSTATYRDSKLLSMDEFLVAQRESVRLAIQTGFQL